MSDNLFLKLSQGYHDDPERIVIETPAGRTVSFRQLTALSGQMANVLQEIGVEPGDRVAVQVEKSVEALALYLATLRAGAVFLPLNTAYTLAELGYFIEDSQPKLVVGRPSQERDLKRLIAESSGAGRLLTLGDAGQGSLMEQAKRAPTRFTEVERGPADLAAILYTSGTTGRSKGAMLTIDNLFSNATTLKELWRFSPADILLHALPIYHVHGLFVAFNMPLLAGARFLLLDRFDAALATELMPRTTVLMGVPTFYTRLLAEPGFDQATVASMRLFISGSAPLLAETHTRFAERTGLAILERYGMTETGMLTSNPYDGPRKPGTVGLPLPGVELRVVDKDDAPLPQGEVGLVQVKGPNVFKGYWRLAEKTRAEFTADGFFRTGDMGMLDSDGYLSIVGRAKDVIIAGGLNIYPKEIEALLDALPEVEESAVIGLPHKDLGEGVAAVVVLRPDASLTLDEVTARLEGTLARFKLPRRLFIVDALPRNAMAKVNKASLRSTFKDGFRA